MDSVKRSVLKEKEFWILLLIAITFVVLVAVRPVGFVLTVQKMKIDGLLLLTGAVIGFSKRTSKDGYFYMLGALWPAYGLAVALMILKALEMPDKLFSPLSYICLGLAYLFVACLVLVVFCGYKSLNEEFLAKKDPTSNNAPSDLALDLRLSRAHARRSKVGR